MNKQKKGGKMKRNYRLILLLVVTILFSACVSLKIEKKIVEVDDKTGKKSEDVPVDSSVTIGTLDNGLTYYIRENAKPADRLSLRLVVNAGSVDEQESQRGLAHLCEHMAFNGTKNFEKHELIDYLESIGMRFGADLNAYTSFDETVYMLQIPTENDSVLEKGFMVLDDWAENVSYDAEEIDKERKVVHEEWRSGQGANQRILNEVLPSVFYKSRYAKRLPIGLMSVVDSCSYETLRSFYNDWYRPNLMAVVAVGDYDKAKLETLIQNYFSDNQNPDQLREKKKYELPDHEDTKYVIATDKELPRTSVSLYIKHRPDDKGKINNYRYSLVKNIFNSMLNQRYSELAQQPKPPFLGAYAGESQIVRTKNFYVINAGVEETGIEKGLTALLTEVKRVNQHGFLKSELDRTKMKIEKRLENAFKEKDKTYSRQFAGEYSRHFLTGEPIPGIEWEYDMTQTLLPGISIDEVNSIARKMITENNRVLTVAAPEKEGLAIPSKEKLAAIVEKIKNEDTTPYKEASLEKPLIAHPLQPQEIVGEKHYKSHDINEITLSNGIKIYYKKTDFKENQILFRAYSLGGTSLASDNKFVASSSGAEIINSSGLGDFDNVSLKKKLAGTNVSVSSYIGSLTEGINGNCAVSDLETLFKLVYLHFTAPRKDPDAYQSIMAKKINRVKNRSANPRAAFSDTLQTTLTNHHYRTRPLTESVLAEMDLDVAFNFYKERFADGNDFSFFFVGNVDEAKLKKFAALYLGNIPVKASEENWKDVGIDFPKGTIEKEVYAGIAQKSTVALVYNNTMDWSVENEKKLAVTKDVLNIMLREKIREEQGGTYGVRVYGSASKAPNPKTQFVIYFNCSPDRAEELTTLIQSEIENLKTDGPSNINLSKVKEIHQKSREKNLENNNFWIGRLLKYKRYNLGLETLLADIDYVDSFTKKDIQSAAQQYFNDNLVKVIHYPEK